MKHCVDCKFMKKEVMQTPQGMATGMYCAHKECADPVTAEPLPCGVSRREPFFCTVKAIYWEKKEVEEKSVVSIIQKE